MTSTPKSITCPHCGMTSHNINDVFHRYCGNCHMFYEDFDDPRLKPHSYVPSSLHMGDCAVCGHLQRASIHKV